MGKTIERLAVQEEYFGRTRQFALERSQILRLRFALRNSAQDDMTTQTGTRGHVHYPNLTLLLPPVRRAEFSDRARVRHACDDHQLAALGKFP